ncbi:uncharacterized protein LOC118741209 isoform X2 [Rhagoletis pomonella]|uniref:uncharacterized protein LOC118741209 isoform X2 n=1 Tax=Rhagoletis pomonella TaxID=28610 RepID=UPI00178052EF|nr:uncharacterized protein LOC118741209 isoform X2 [Rhagoletis pomonella]
MNKKTFANLMSIEKKAFEKNVENYRRLLLNDENARPINRAVSIQTVKVETISDEESSDEGATPPKRMLNSFEANPTFGKVADYPRIGSVTANDHSRKYKNATPIKRAVNTSSAGKFETARPNKPLKNDETITPLKRVQNSVEAGSIVTPMALNSSGTCGLVVDPQHVEHIVSKDSNAAIIDQQNNLAVYMTNLDTRLRNLEDCVEYMRTYCTGNSSTQSEVMLQDKTPNNRKVTLKVTKSDPLAEVVTMLPLTTIKSADEFEEKLSNKECLQSMRLYLVKLKNLNGFDYAIRKIYTDDFLCFFNWDGLHGRLPLKGYRQISDMLFDVFNFSDKKSFETAMKKFIARSRNRINQKKHHLKTSNA